jgi:DNA-binding beta-propeller fold protein YncE
MGVSAEELAAVTAEQAFVDADVNHDGVLSFEEFKAWYSMPGDEATTQTVVDNAGVGSLEEARRLRLAANLQSYSVEGAGSRDKGTKRTREESDDANDNTTNIHLEVTTGDGVTVKLQLPPTATVLMVKQEVESELGIKPREACVFSGNKAHTDKLQDEETLDTLVVGEEAKLELLLLVEQADAQQVVPELSVEPSLVLGDGTRGNGDTQLNSPCGEAFIAAHPDWLVTTELSGNRIKISNIRTGALVCKFGEDGDGQFNAPVGVAVTSDSSFVLVADYENKCVQVLRLVVGADGISAHLEFVRSLGSWSSFHPSEVGVALLQSNGGQQETVLVTEENNHRVSQFALDGTFVGIFAGTGKSGSGDGEFKGPRGITVLASSGEVAVADQFNHRVQIFDSEGKYKRQFRSSKFGTVGFEADGELFGPAGLAADAHGNLLVTDWTNRLHVFSPKGKHLCIRSDLSLHGESIKGIAWSADGEIAVANGEAHTVLVWYSA